MDIITILTIGIPTLASIVVGVILRKQINSQNELLANYKNYIETTDWKKIKEHYENYVIPQLEELYTRNNLNSIRDVVANSQKYEERIKKEFEELLSVCVFCLKRMEKEDAMKLIDSLKFGKSDIQALLDDAQ